MDFTKLNKNIPSYLNWGVILWWPPGLGYNLKKAINFDYVDFFYNFYVTDTMWQVLEYVLDNLQDLNFMLCIQT